MFLLDLILEQLTKVCLDYCKISDAECAALDKAASSSPHTKLERLAMEENKDITLEGCAYLSTFLADCPTIRTLCLPSGLKSAKETLEEASPNPDFLAYF